MFLIAEDFNAFANSEYITITTIFPVFYKIKFHFNNRKIVQDFSSGNKDIVFKNRN